MGKDVREYRCPFEPLSVQSVGDAEWLLVQEQELADFHYGGQAVLEGVMMRGQKRMTVAVRDPSGRIVLHSEPLTGGIYDSVWRKVPFVRGLLVLWDALVLGTRTLMYSANVALSEDEVELTTPAILVTLVLSLIFGVGLFFVLPLVLVGFLDRFITSGFVSNLLEGLIRLLLLLLYLSLIGLVPDISRVFAYHGAEHKTIGAFESGAPLDTKGVSTYSTAHARCGTGFLLIVVLLSVLIFVFLGRPPMVWRIISRVLLIPVIAGISYEFIRFTANHRSNPLVKAFILPSMMLQTLTTREPDESMLEVAIAALNAVLAADGVLEGEG
ncbi:MAG: hypothetical protein CEE40_02865 [Chloroflexi bacterium B3_Chlor]|nr:MAG: hypothetical protein CEE40_02865 [Chloroflexi bacterium B3_Chlor]